MKLTRARQTRHLTLGTLCTLVAFLGAAGLLSAEEVGRFARISEIEGEVQLWRYGAPDWEYGAINMLIEEGDVLETGRGDYAEVQLDNGTAIRLGEETEIEILELSRDYGEREWVSAISLVQGTVNVWTPDYEEWQSFFDIETPRGLVTVDEDSDVRVDVSDGSGRTEILVYRGLADVIGREGYVTVYGGEKTRLSTAGEPFDPWRFDVTATDRFDRWCRDLPERRTHVVRERHVDTEIYIGVSDLEPYGTWVFVADYGYCWRPVVVEPDWRPYRYGRWVWSVRWGWTWIPSEPWGWVPYHYGRWAWVGGHGWVWIPGSVFGPGWVSWCSGPGWIAWVPLGPYDYPCCWNLGLHVNVWTCVGYDDFYAPRYRWKPYPGGEPHKPYRAYAAYRNDVRVEQEQFTRKPPRNPEDDGRGKTVTRRGLGVREELSERKESAKLKRDGPARQPAKREMERPAGDRTKTVRIDNGELKRRSAEELRERADRETPTKRITSESSGERREEPDRRDVPDTRDAGERARDRAERRSEPRQRSSASSQRTEEPRVRPPERPSKDGTSDDHPAPVQERDRSTIQRPSDREKEEVQRPPARSAQRDESRTQAEATKRVKPVERARPETETERPKVERPRKQTEQAPAPRVESRTTPDRSRTRTDQSRKQTDQTRKQTDQSAKERESARTRGRRR